MQRSVNQMTATTREEGAGTPHRQKGFIGKTAEKPRYVRSANRIAVTRGYGVKNR